jgi:RNA polymerase sigma-70 factor (ECF subfamily)
MKFGFDIDLSKEVVHSGFVKLWETRKTLSADLSIKAYLYKIIYNTSVDVLRHQKVKHKHEKYVLQHNGPSINENGFGDLELKHLAADIDKAVAELPEQMRKIFELSRYGGFKYAEISSQLNISVKTVETQMSRALVKLRHKLSNYLPTCLILFCSFI